MADSKKMSDDEIVAEELKKIQNEGEPEQPAPAAAAARTADGRKKPRKHKKRSKARIAQIVVGIVLVVAALATSVGGFALDKLSLLQYSNGSASGDNNFGNEGGLISDDEMAGLKKVTDVPGLPDGEITTDPNVFNILLLGTDDRTSTFSDNARSDSMIVVSVNTKTNKIKMASFERATGVPVLAGTYKGQYDWLTHCFRYGGANLVMQELQSCFLLDVTHYVRVNIRSYMELIDAVGGVDITLTSAEANYLNSSGDYYNGGRTYAREMGVLSEMQTVKTGKNHLNGTTAMVYSRSRGLDSDWGRMKRQRNVLEAIYSNMKNLSVSQLNSMMNKMLPLVQTNLSRTQLTSLMLQVPSLAGASMTTTAIPRTNTYGVMTGMGGRSLFAVDFTTNAAYLKKYFYKY